MNISKTTICVLCALPLAACGAPEDVDATTGDGVEVVRGAVTLTCHTTRTTGNRPDDIDRYQVRALYVIPSDGTDERLDTNGRICRSLSAGDTWLRNQTTNGAGLRFDTASARLDIGFVRLNKTDQQMRGTSNSNDLETGFAFLRDRIERELKTMGHINNPKKVYAVYYGGSTPWSCGGGAWPPLLMGQVAAMYVNGAPPGSPACNTNLLGASATVPGYFEYSMVHEIMHTIGIVGDQAPNEHSAGHVFDGNVDAATAARDLMYAQRSASDPFWGTNDPNGLILDVGRNDYYGHGQSGYPDLARSVFMKPLPSNAQRPPGW